MIVISNKVRDFEQKGDENIEYKKFKKLDLGIFCFLGALSEFLSYFLLTKFTSTIYVSFGVLLFIIASIRWGRSSIIVLLISSIPLLFVTHVPPLEGILYYVVGGLFASVPIMIYGKKDKNKLRDKPLSLFLYTLAVFLSLTIGKSFMLIILGDNQNVFASYFGSILLTLVITIIFVLLLNTMKQELVVDMDVYLKRINEVETYEK